MALQPLPPIPNTRLVDAPDRDAIWRRYLEQVFALLSQVNNTGVVGPGSSTDNAIARWNGTTGQAIQNSGVIIDDANSITGVSSFSAISGIFSGAVSSSTLNVTSNATVNGTMTVTSLTGYVYANGASPFTASTTINASTFVGLSSMAFQSSSAVAITGGTINATGIGATTASTGAFSNLSVTSLAAARVVYTGASGLMSVNDALQYDSATSTLTVSGVVSLPDGTAAAPSLKVGDEQNGFFSDAVNQISGAVGGGKRFSFASTEMIFVSPNAGGSATIRAQNSSNTADSHAVLRALAAGTSGGDPFTLYSITGGSAWSAGADNSDSDSYKISNNSTLGTNDYLIITTAGVVTLPTVNIDGGNIDSTAIGATTASTGVFTNVSTTTLFSTSTATLPLVNIDGGNIDSTAIGANTASTGVYTNVSTTTLFSTSTATLPLVNIDGGNIDSTALGAATASTGVFTNVSTATFFSSGNATIGDGAADSLTINAETVSQPNIPCFASYVSTNINNVTGAGTSYTVIWDSERYDQSADFNTTTGTFTASVTGKYDLVAQVRLINIPAGSTSAFISIVTSNVTWTTSTGMAFVAGTFIAFPFQISVQADMEAGDTATVIISASAGAGDTADVAGSASMISFFCGRLSA